MPDLNISFEGPFSFTDGAKSLFRSPYAQVEGLYLWTIQQTSDGSHLIHYVGETKSFAKRHREHLIQILAMNYGIFCPLDASSGKCTRLWDGLWRDKSPEGPGRLIAEYPKLSGIVPDYLAAIRVFVAPTTLEQHIRRHVEGCFGWHLRTKHPSAMVLYPADNRIPNPRTTEHGNILIKATATIRGLDEIIPY